MSRAINVSLTEDDVRARCEKTGVLINVIEPLPAGGTRVVCRTSEGADEIRHRLRAHIMEGPIKRSPFYQAKGPWKV